MTYMTVKPNRNANAIANDFDQMFSQLFGADHQFSCQPSAKSNWPAVNISETDHEIKLTLEAAGATKENIKVSIKENVLTINGKRESQIEDDKSKQIVSEIRSGDFSRSFTLPETVDTDKIKADFQNGLLLVRLAKLEEIKPKEIEVSVA